MLGVRFQNDKYENRNESIRALLPLLVAKKALNEHERSNTSRSLGGKLTEYNFAAIKHTDKFVPRCFEVVDLQELWT